MIAALERLNRSSRFKERALCAAARGIFVISGTCRAGHGNEFGGVPHDMSRSAATGSRAVRRLAAKREWGRGT